MRCIRRSDDKPLVIPEDAVVVPGSRAVTHPAAVKWGMSLQTAVIVKYRDAKDRVANPVGRSCSLDSLRRSTG